MALTKVFLDRYVVFASVGSVFHVDQVLSVAAVTATRPGGATVDTGQVVSTGDQSTATFAVGPPLVPSGNAIFLQFTVNPFTATSVAASRAFSDLQVALYGSQHPARSNLLAATSTDLSWPGPSASAPVPVGNTNWTLVASARSPLIGTFASSAPFLTLVLGLLIALFAGGFVEILIRRRKFVLPASESRSTGLVEPAPVAEVPPAEVPVEPAPVAEVPPAEVPVEPAPVAEAPVEPRLPVYESDVIDQDEPATPDQTEPPSSPWSEAVDEEHHAVDISPSETSVYADWRPDPFGRFEFRRFFLDSPTSLVRDRSIERYDPAGAVPGPPADLRQGEVDDQPSSMSAAAEYEDSDDLEHHDHAPGKTNGPDDLDVRTPDSQQLLEPATNVPGDLDMPPSDTEKVLETVAERVAGAIAEELEGLRAVASALNQYLPEADASEVHRTNQRPVTPLAADRTDSCSLLRLRLP